MFRSIHSNEPHLHSSTGKDARASTYKPSTIKSAAEAAFSNVLAKKKVGDNNYPHSYGMNDDGVKFTSSVCKKGDDLYEFPIKTHGKFTSGSVKDLPDRVVIKKKSKKEAYYCGLITHINAHGDANAPFTSCSG
ncbi:hypothetical protein AWENTII_006432 [Aspergillus wentii]